MKQSSKSIIAFLGLMLIYILLAGVGIYSTAGILLFPILSLPLALCLIKNKLTYGTDFIFNVIIISGIYLFTNNLQSVLIYIIGVYIPAYTASIFYKRQIPLPNTIMYISIIMTVSVFIYLSIMKYWGVDYEGYFIGMIDETRVFYIELMDLLIQSSPTQNVLEQSILKEVITLITDTIKKVYPALILTTGLLLASVQMVLLNVLQRGKSLRASILKQLFNFKLSKISVLLLFLAMLIPMLSQNTNGILVIVSLNVLFFLQNLMLIMGIISIVVLVKRASIHSAFKVLSYFVLIILVIASSNLLMIFGCFDTLFNYRKAQIIV